jgi:HK97 family phage prohead protease
MYSDLPESSGGREQLLESLEAYRRGLGDAPVVHQWSDGGVRTAEDDQTPLMVFVISTDEVDRHGDVIVPEGWRLESYLRNPVLLWAHDYTRPVIGRAVAVWKEAHSLLARLEFAPTRFAQEVALLYRDRYQRGVSVGFKPIAYEERRHDKTGAFLGIRFLEQELLEVSAVPVPANRSALRRAAGRSPRMEEYWRWRRPTSPSVVDAASVEAIWPGLAARVDDLQKLIGELSEITAWAEAAGNPPVPEDVADMLAILREARR